MKKIVIDARMINNSGIGTYLQNMISNLIKNYELILLGNEKEIDFFSWSGKVKVLKFLTPIYSLSEQMFFPLKIPECDLFISPHYNIPLLPVRAAKRIVIIHDVFHLVFLKELSFRQKFYAKFMISKAVKKSDKIITVSHFSKKEILKHVQVEESKMDVIYCGFDFNEFSEDSNFKVITDYKSEIPQEYFLFVSNIKPHKNLFNLLLAYKIFLKSYENVDLVVVGEFKKLITSDEKSLKFIKENSSIESKVKFTGYIKREELLMLYKKAIALVFPSTYEGFGLPPIEAMACNCPVIASGNASIPEACADAALYINSSDINDMSEKMKRIYSDGILRHHLIEKGKQNIKRFTNKDFRNNLINVISSLLKV